MVVKYFSERALKFEWHEETACSTSTDHQMIIPQYGFPVSATKYLANSLLFLIDIDH